MFQQQNQMYFPQFMPQQNQMFFRQPGFQNMPFGGAFGQNMHQMFPQPQGQGFMRGQFNGYQMNQNGHYDKS
jgi:hypothetical protein